MIEINLLPPEHRPVERTPLPRLLTILTGVLLAAVGAVTWLWLIVVAVPNAEGRCRDRKQAMEKAQAVAAEVKKIDDELKAAKDREDVLRDLFVKRLCWARLLDRLAEVRGKLKAGEDVVLTDVELRKSTAAQGRGRPAEVRRLYVKGFVASDRKDTQAGELREACFKFIQLLCNDAEFKQDFECDEKGDGAAKYLYLGDQMSENLGPPTSGKETKNAAPKSALTFEVTFDFKASPAPAPKPAAKPAVGSAQAGAH